jgi:bifunctional enzyme CysN/CysC
LQTVDVERTERAALNGHRQAVILLTGLPGAGKSTIANLVDRELHDLGVHTVLLDGDNIRNGLSSDLGFSAPDRVENMRRIGEVTRLMADAGLIVIASFIAPYRQERGTIRALLGPGEFYEVFVDTDQAVAEARDRKGLYARARAGEIPDFTGVDSPYEAPQTPELRIDTARMTAQQAARRIVERLADDGLISRSA